MVTIYNAISLDGFIATKDDNTDWVKDWDEYEAILKDSDAIIYGRRTYDDMIAAETFPLADIKNYVYTSTPEKYETISEATFTNVSPLELIESIRSSGAEKIIIGGGGQTNATFLMSGVVDRVIVDLHPILLGDGIRLFNNLEGLIELKVRSQKMISNGLLQIEYDVVKD